MYRTGKESIRCAVYKRERRHYYYRITTSNFRQSNFRVNLSVNAFEKTFYIVYIVRNIRDESNHENPTCSVITPRSNRINMHELMDYFETTELERSYRINLNLN